MPSFIQLINPANYGEALRPTPKIDDAKRLKRGLLFFFGMTIVIVLLLFCFIYYSLNPGSKTETVKQDKIDKAKTDELFHKEYEEEISVLDCKCLRTVQEGYPLWLDSGMVAEECEQETPLYKRCLDVIPLAKVEYEAAKLVCPNMCECEEESNYNRQMCGKLVSSFIAEYKSLAFKTKYLTSYDSWLDDAAFTYRNICHKVVEAQATSIELLFGSLSLISEADPVEFARVAVDGYQIPLAGNASYVCGEPIWDDKTQSFLGPGGEYGPLFSNDAEELSLQKQYYNKLYEPSDSEEEEEVEGPGHWQRCQPQLCTYSEEEGWQDFALKTVALFSPIMAGVMTAVGMLYGLTDDHWSAREKRMQSLGTVDGKVDNDL